MSADILILITHFPSGLIFYPDLDKQTINQAAVFGLRSDLELTGQEFSWAVSLFYLGQLCSEYPAAIILSRFPITIYVGVTIVIWGGVNMCLAAVHNFAGLAAVRFFLGFSEGKTHFIYPSASKTNYPTRNRLASFHYHY